MQGISFKSQNSFLNPMISDFMHRVSLFYYENQQKKLQKKVLRLKLINNKFLYSVFFRSLYIRLVDYGLNQNSIPAVIPLC